MRFKRSQIETKHFLPAMFIHGVKKFRGKSHYKGNDRGGKRDSHENSIKGKKSYDKRIKGQVVAAIKKQRKEEKVDQ